MMMSELPDVDESETTLSFAAPFRKVHRSFNWGKGGDLENLKKKIGHRMYEQCLYRKWARDIYMNAFSL
jgi:hypothetical protein